jgi:hypothetical protein
VTRHIKGGYRVGVLPTFAVTPYGAVQFQDFHTPSYNESGVIAGGFGLTYDAMNATDVRTELGARFDAPTLLYGVPLILYGRAAWAHDFVHDSALNAVFESLPGVRRSHPARLDADHRRRAIVHESQLVAHRQLRGRIRQRLADLRRKGHPALHLVTRNTSAAPPRALIGANAKALLLNKPEISMSMP